MLVNVDVNIDTLDRNVGAFVDETNVELEVVLESVSIGVVCGFVSLVVVVVLFSVLVVEIREFVVDEED